MHRHSWIHRDLKLENMLVTASNDVKICDFGWSAEIELEQLLKTTCGTTAYWAPEMWEHAAQDEAVDLWALGCMLYEMLAGHSPFYASDQEELKRKVLGVKFAFPPWFSNEACHITASLLQREPRRRLRCKELLGHSWLYKHATRKPNQVDTVSPSRLRLPAMLEPGVPRSPLLRSCTPLSHRREVSFDVNDVANCPSPARLRLERAASPSISRRLPCPLVAAGGHVTLNDLMPTVPGTPSACGCWHGSSACHDQAVSATPSVPGPLVMPSTPIAQSHRHVSPSCRLSPPASVAPDSCRQPSPLSSANWHVEQRHKSAAPCRGADRCTPNPQLWASQRASWGPPWIFGASSAARPVVQQPAIMLPVPVPTSQAPCRPNYLNGHSNNSQCLSGKAPLEQRWFRSHCQYRQTR